MDNEAVITLKPKLGYWIAKYLLLVVIVLLIPYLIRPFIVDVILDYMVMGVCIIAWIMLCYTYIDMLFATKWIITKDELISRHGLFIRREEHLELYRVIDYSEKQNLLQILFKNKTVKVVSGDSSDPILYMYGIDKKVPIIGILRDRVRIARKESGIYEVTNR